MSSFTLGLLEEGVEVEISTDLSKIISILDQEVPHFSCQGHGYSVTTGKATLGKRWDLMVKSINYSNRELPPTLVGRVELEKIEGDRIQFRFPPRAELNMANVTESDPDGRILGSFIFQTLNALQRHRLIKLPGVLPTI